MEEKKLLTAEEITEALRNITGGTFEMSGTTTLLGWIPQYDKQGRPLNADPNYIDYSVNIEGTEYDVTKHGWDVYVWKPEFKQAQYTNLWTPDYMDHVLAHIDLTPDYLKEDNKE